MDAGRNNVFCKVRGRGRFLPPTVSHSHEGTGKPRKTCADTAGHSLWDLIFVSDISITNIFRYLQWRRHLWIDEESNGTVGNVT